jgi:hypothetical protein
MRWILVAIWILPDWIHTLLWRVFRVALIACIDTETNKIVGFEWTRSVVVEGEVETELEVEAEYEEFKGNQVSKNEPRG